MRVLLFIALLALLAPAAQAHGVFEAQELEIHVLNDEGSDVIEAYGGYDIQDAFLGSGYLPGLGDLVYVRLVLYGQFSPQTATMPWVVRVHYDSADGPQTHQLSTLDGQAFTHDFAGMDFEIEAAERTTHIHRAYLTKGAPVPGQPLTGLRVESFWGTDLRDVAPGGIPVPGSGGLLEYPEPTAIPGEGRLVDTPIPPGVGAYFGDLSAHRNDTQYDLNVPNALRSGGQHFHLSVLNGTGWILDGFPAQAVVDANSSTTFQFTASPQFNDVAPLILQLTSDVGGRVDLTVTPDQKLHARGAEVPTTVKEAPGMQASSPAFTALALALVGFAWLQRRRTEP